MPVNLDSYRERQKIPEFLKPFHDKFEEIGESSGLETQVGSMRKDEHYIMRPNGKNKLIRVQFNYVSGYGHFMTTDYSFGPSHFNFERFMFISEQPNEFNKLMELEELPVSDETLYSLEYKNVENIHTANTYKAQHSVKLEPSLALFESLVEEFISSVLD